MIKSFDDILAQGAFMGCELTASPCDSVNPGLGLGVAPGLGLYKEMLGKYATLSFINEDGMNLTTIVKYTTDLLISHGFKPTNEIQRVAGVTIYPSEYFNPLDNNTGILKITSHTHSIHWYTKTWLEVHPFRIKISRISHRILGYRLSAFIRNFLHIK